LAAGEPPATRGFPPSVFTALPRLLERTGRSAVGSITAFYTVLVEGDDLNEPISDAVRALLDGHIVLSRKLAGAGHYPAIDILDSISRLAPAVTTPDHQSAMQRLRGLLAAYRDHEDLISVGAYRPGTNPQVDQALALREPLLRYLRQAHDQRCTLEAAVRELLQLAEACSAVNS
jgi:flagellar biosynthesis/type III secretory pathway ATPase